jgi:hypothetical protein
MHRRIVFIAVAAFGCQKGSPVQQAHTPANSVEGTWRAVEYINVRAEDSALRYPFGRPPHGYLVYDPTGHVFLQVVRGLATDARARGHWHDADSATLFSLLNGSVAYFGEYRANYATSTVVHLIDAEIPPNIGMTEVATPFQIRGDTLQLGRDSSVHWLFVRVRPGSLRLPSNRR